MYLYEMPKLPICLQNEKYATTFMAMMSEIEKLDLMEAMY